MTEPTYVMARDWWPFRESSYVIGDRDALTAFMDERVDAVAAYIANVASPHMTSEQLEVHLVAAAKTVEVARTSDSNPGGVSARLADDRSVEVTGTINLASDGCSDSEPGATLTAGRIIRHIPGGPGAVCSLSVEELPAGEPLIPGTDTRYVMFRYMWRPATSAALWWFGDRDALAAYLDERVDRVAARIAAGCQREMSDSDLQSLLIDATHTVGVPWSQWPNPSHGVFAQFGPTLRDGGRDIEVIGAIPLDPREVLTASRVIRHNGWTVEQTPPGQPERGLARMVRLRRVSVRWDLAWMMAATIGAAIILLTDWGR